MISSSTSRIVSLIKMTTPWIFAVVILLVWFPTSTPQIGESIPTTSKPAPTLTERNLLQSLFSSLLSSEGQSPKQREHQLRKKDQQKQQHQQEQEQQDADNEPSAQSSTKGTASSTARNYRLAEEEATTCEPYVDNMTFPIDPTDGTTASVGYNRISGQLSIQLQSNTDVTTGIGIEFFANFGGLILSRYNGLVDCEQDGVERIINKVTIDTVPINTTIMKEFFNKLSADKENRHLTATTNSTSGGNGATTTNTGNTSNMVDTYQFPSYQPPPFHRSLQVIETTHSIEFRGKIIETKTTMYPNGTIVTILSNTTEASTGPTISPTKSPIAETGSNNNNTDTSKADGGGVANLIVWIVLIEGRCRGCGAEEYLFGDDITGDHRQRKLVDGIFQESLQDIHHVQPSQDTTSQYTMNKELRRNPDNFVNVDDDGQKGASDAEQLQGMHFKIHREDQLSLLRHGSRSRNRLATTIDRSTVKSDGTGRGTDLLVHRMDRCDGKPEAIQHGEQHDHHHPDDQHSGKQPGDDYHVELSSSWSALRPSPVQPLQRRDNEGQFLQEKLTRRVEQDDGLQEPCSCSGPPIDEFQEEFSRGLDEVQQDNGDDEPRFTVVGFDEKENDNDVKTKFECRPRESFEETVRIDLPLSLPARIRGDCNDKIARTALEAYDQHNLFTGQFCDPTRRVIWRSTAFLLVSDDGERTTKLACSSFHNDGPPAELTIEAIELSVEFFCTNCHGSLFDDDISSDDGIPQCGHFCGRNSVSSGITKEEYQQAFHQVLMAEIVVPTPVPIATAAPTTPSNVREKILAEEADCSDADDDGICDAHDNCPETFNPSQEDFDNDDIGDACDPCPTDAENWDFDGDGWCDIDDNCEDVYNPDQEDRDDDGIGDACDKCPDDKEDTDTDRDGICDSVDNCPTAPNPNQQDRDDDGIGDACDACPNDPTNDEDGDGVCGTVDNCPTITNPGQEDVDKDGIGDACDDSFDTPARLVPPTASPFVPPTPFPVVPMPSLVVPPTQLPVVPPTQIPVVPPTQSPVLPRTLSPIVSPTAPPVVPPTFSPVATPKPSVLRPTADASVASTPSPMLPSPAPVRPTPSPVHPTTAPVRSTLAPVPPTAYPVIPTPVPVSQATPAPVVLPTPATMQPTQAPVVPPTTAPVQATPAPALAQKPVLVLLAPPSCGNGIVDVGEQCDDGNTNDNDACTNACQDARCGDGIKGPGEACDDPTDNCCLSDCTKWRGPIRECEE